MAAAVAAWWVGAQFAEAGGRLALGSLLAAGVAAVWAGRRWRTPALSLAWDGGAWQLAAPGGEPRAGQALPMLDLGHWMLVRFTPEDAGRTAWRRAVWLPLSRRENPHAWPALRVALHAPQPARRAA
ncbi:MAG TPA: hypothetical protein PKB14_12075 [Rubrivivax sp.]|nr:hypothetical protein [Rubrivivax sp.]